MTQGDKIINDNVMILKLKTQTTFRHASQTIDYTFDYKNKIQCRKHLF